MFILVIVGITAGLLVGYELSHFLTNLYARRVTTQAQLEAEELLTESKADGELAFAEAKAKVADYEEELREQFEKDTASINQRIANLESVIGEKEQDLNSAWQRRESQIRKQEDIVKSFAVKIAELSQRLQLQQKNANDIKTRYIERLTAVSQASVPELKSQIYSRLESDQTVRTTREVQIFEEEFQQEVEKAAKATIRIVIDRFARPYCPERGIGNVDFQTPEIMARTLGPDRKHLRRLEQECGVDISVNDQYLSASILGFDPVRRELGRASLERLVQERQPTDQRIVDIVANTKRELFKKIRRDGNRIAQELKANGLSDEVRDMMGALRYRYSFAQNQFFHCGEVGFLCGLLSGELKLPVADGRRAGLLHDIGKAMDHSIDGGHAVIGADFIQKNGEAPHIVHAVRAHHHDETPNTDLAFLVIAADAISGARPGARRSTIDSYTQKMADLEKIGSSFDGVIGTYIMSAGREVRVIVDSHHIDDHKALDLSKEIAKRIEEECSYPGLIKVTVVRETQAIDYAK